MGQICAIPYDFAAGVAAAVLVPRALFPPTPLAVNGNVVKGSKAGVLRRVLIVPKFSAAQLAGAAADVVAARNSMDSLQFRVFAGNVILFGPICAPWAADPSPRSGLGVAGADAGGAGMGFVVGAVPFDFAEGLMVDALVTAVVPTIAIAYTVHLEVEIGP